MKSTVLLLTTAALALAASPASQPVSAAPAVRAAASESVAPREAATTFAAALEENYLFPEIGTLYAEMLRRNAAAGAYDGLDRSALAKRLTADLQAVSPDGHLRVSAGVPGGHGGPSRGGAAMREPFPDTMLERACWLAPGIAYARLNLFPGEAESIARMKQLVADYQSARTLILDVRKHYGGELDEIDVLLPYLYAAPASLAMLETRAAVDARGGGFRDGPTLTRVPAPDSVVRREHKVTPGLETPLRHAAVMVLTSRGTISAAEHLSFVLKRTGRATLIGETTRGAGHYDEGFKLPGGMVGYVPVGRTFAPETGRGWEGEGVAPDVAVPAERALSEALRRAGLEPGEAERIGAGGCGA